MMARGHKVVYIHLQVRTVCFWLGRYILSVCRGGTYCIFQYPTPYTIFWFQPRFLTENSFLSPELCWEFTARERKNTSWKTCDDNQNRRPKQRIQWTADRFVVAGFRVLLDYSLLGQCCDTCHWMGCLCLVLTYRLNCSKSTCEITLYQFQI